MTDRYCLRDGCRAPLVQRAGETPGHFKTREFCDHGCAMRHVHEQSRIGVEQHKTCPGCGVVFHWPEGVPKSQWLRKTYCTSECGTAYMNVAGRRRRPAGAPARKRAAKPRPEVPVPDPVQRPRVEDLAPDPHVVDMDRRRRDAERLLDSGVAAWRIATDLGVSIAQVHRWDRGER